MSKYIEYPGLYGINIVNELSPDNYYQIAQSQTAVFPFRLGVNSAIKISASHTSFYDNQQGTISGWASDEINGRSITSAPNTLMSRIQLQGTGFTWLFYAPNTTLTENAQLTQWIDPEQTYYMCFQNLENKSNGLFAQFTYLP